MPKASAKSRKQVLYLVVFFTNLLSLACQVIWVRKLSFLFGSTAGVFSTVLSVFLLGLAVGALVAGRLADRTGHPWKLLARVQIALGVYVAVSLPIFDLARRFYLQAFPNDLSPMSAALWKFAVVLVVLITPTLAIGATFPLAVRLLTRNAGDVGGSVSLVYGLDTMGAALGALLSGFIFVTGFGLSASTWMLGAVSVIFGLWVLGAKFEGVAIEPERKGAAETVTNIKKDKVRQKKLQAVPDPAAASSAEPPPGPSADTEPWPAWQLGLVLGMFFLSGLAALVLETGWNRLFYLMNGTSVYSLSSVLTGFLTGIGLGSLAMRKRIDRLADPLSAVAITYAVIALGGVLVLRSGSFFEWMYLAIFEATNSYLLFQILVSLTIAGIVFSATVAMGANFPLVTKICTRVAEKRGFAVGRVFFWNTLGAVLGAFLGEFWLLPRFGFAGLGVVTLGIYALGAAVFLALSKGEKRNRAAVLCAALLVAAVLLSPLVIRFELPVHAVYYHGLRNGNWQNFREELAQMKVIDEKQGFYGQVAVLEYGSDLLLKHNGKTDASTSIKDNRTQILLGHLPLFFHPKPKQVLAIGLGGGATLRALAHNPDLEEITMVEIDPLVTEAARTFFGKFNDHALDDPRVRIVTNDGRNYIDSSRRTYDIISSEPPNIWVAGVSGLFTQEFYRSAKAHLNPGGVLCQWMPLYEMQAPDFRIILHTIRSLFPHIRFWAVGADIALVASDRPLVTDEAKVRARLSYPGVLADLREIEMSPEELLVKLSNPDIPSDRLPSFIGKVDVENTDDLPILEFSTARNLYTFAKEK